jgi:hypothetical protein
MKHARTTKSARRAVIGTEAEGIIRRFSDAPDDALFLREEVAAIRRCSRAKLERECWLGIGIPVIKDNGRALYRKRDIAAYLNGLSAKADVA